MRFVELEEARQARGLRLVVGAAVPSAWSEAAKAIFHVKGIEGLLVRCDLRNQPIRAWTGIHNTPVALHDDEPPRSHWTEILALGERLAPHTPLLPAARDQRLRVLGLIHEISSEGGLVWSARLMQLDLSLRSEGTAGFPLPVAQHLAAKYGYAPDRIPAARERVRDVLTTLAEHLAENRTAGSPYLLGDRLTALDLYTATALAPFALLPDDLCPLQPVVRRMFDPLAEASRPLLPPTLLAHRDLIYRTHLELPVRV